MKATAKGRAGEGFRTVTSGARGGAVRPSQGCSGQADVSGGTGQPATFHVALGSH